MLSPHGKPEPKNRPSEIGQDCYRVGRFPSRGFGRPLVDSATPMVLLRSSQRGFGSAQTSFARSKSPQNKPSKHPLQSPELFPRQPFCQCPPPDGHASRSYLFGAHAGHAPRISFFGARQQRRGLQKPFRGRAADGGKWARIPHSHLEWPGGRPSCNALATVNQVGMRLGMVRRSRT